MDKKRIHSFLNKIRILNVMESATVIEFEKERKAGQCFTNYCLVNSFRKSQRESLAREIIRNRVEREEE